MVSSRPSLPGGLFLVAGLMLSGGAALSCDDDDGGPSGMDLAADGDDLSDSNPADGSDLFGPDVAVDDSGDESFDESDASGDLDDPVVYPSRELVARVVLGEGGFFGVSGAWLAHDTLAFARPLAVGAHYADISGGVGDPNPAGRLYLFGGSGIPDDIDDAGLVLQPPDGSAGGGFAYSTGNLCDANGDGALDLPVGNHLYLDPTAPNAGRVVMFWGDPRGIVDLGTSSTYHRLSDGLRARSDVLGQTVLCVDVDGDGLDDLIATGQNAGPDDTGLAAIYMGTEEGLPLFESAVLLPPIAASRQYFGSATLWEDLDGDGSEDLAVGAWGLIKGESSSDPHTGGVLVFAGGDDWTGGPAYALYPTGNGAENMGSRLSTAEVGETRYLFVGATRTGAQGADDPAPGAIYVYQLGSPAFADEPVQILSPPAGFEDVGFGQSFVFVPDYHGAGRGALLAGMKYADASTENTGTGVVAVYRQQPGESLQEPFVLEPELLLAPAPQGMDAFGGNIVALPDLTGDGLTDFWVSMESHIEGDMTTGTQTGGVVFYY